MLLLQAANYVGPAPRCYFRPDPPCPSNCGRYRRAIQVGVPKNRGLMDVPIPLLAWATHQIAFSVPKTGKQRNEQNTISRGFVASQLLREALPSDPEITALMYSSPLLREPP